MDPKTEAIKTTYLIAKQSPAVRYELLQAVRPLMTEEQFNALQYCVAYMVIEMDPEHKKELKDALAKTLYDLWNS